jgi:uncharacterized protein YutE (UPF0331/DUF86 family)
MTPLDAAMVRRKLTVIARNLDDLATVAGLSPAEYLDDRIRQKATERLLQELVDAAVDTNLHLLRDVGAAAPPDYHESFIALGREAILSDDLAARLAPAAGLRNRLVHEYDTLDHGIVLQAVSRARRDFAEYVAAVEGYLEAQGH